MKKLLVLLMTLAPCMLQASGKSDIDGQSTRPRTPSLETIIISRSTSAESIVPQQPMPATQPHIMDRQVPMRRQDPVILSTWEVLRQTAQTYVDEYQNYYQDGCCKGCTRSCHAPGNRPDLNPHRQVQRCRSSINLGCTCLIGLACSGACGYGLITVCPR